MHLKNLMILPDQFQVVGIADPTEENLQAVVDQYHLPYYSADYHELLQKDDVDCVLIASATDTHAQIIKDAARAGKDIFVKSHLILMLRALKVCLQLSMSVVLSFKLVLTVALTIIFGGFTNALLMVRLVHRRLSKFHHVTRSHRHWNMLSAQVDCSLTWWFMTLI